MLLIETVKIGINGLTAHKLRTFLTMLGIIFGVAAVIAMLSIGEGGKQETLAQYEIFGIDNIIIREEKMTDEEKKEARQQFSLGLSLEDVEVIKTICPSVQEIVPQKERDITANYMDRECKSTVVATIPEYPELLNFYPETGRFFSPREMREKSRVCVIGYEVKRKLFFLEDPLGKSLKIGNIPFVIIGVMEEKNVLAETAGTLASRDLNRDIYVLLSTGYQYFDKARLDSILDQITVKIKETSQLVESSFIIKNILLRLHHKVEDFEIIIPEELIIQRQKTERIFNVVLASIAGISLLVGGIGIMNIMLSSVLERTREIGIRMAVGANRRNVLNQFIFEAIFISFCGGGLGILLGTLMANAIARFADMKTLVTPNAILLAFGVSVAVGLIFGIFPARKASYLDPIEALRYE